MPNSISHKKGFSFQRPQATLVAIALLLTGIDQSTKAMARHWLQPEHSWVLIPHTFQLSLAYNTGAAFSLLEQYPVLLTAFTTLLFLALTGFALSRSHYRSMERNAYALLIGGAFGNLLDRALQHQVTDFFDFIVIHYPVFNMADVFIFFGAVFLMIDCLFPQTQPDASLPADPHG